MFHPMTSIRRHQRHSHRSQLSMDALMRLGQKETLLTTLVLALAVAWPHALFAHEPAQADMKIFDPNSNWRKIEGQ